MSPADEAAHLLKQLAIENSGDLVSFSPIDGAEIGRAAIGDPAAACERAASAFLVWR